MDVSATCLPNFMLLQLKKVMQQLEAKPGVGQNFNIFPQKGKFSIIERVFYLKKFSASERSASTISLMNL